jgi:hypothetical protein
VAVALPLAYFARTGGTPSSRAAAAPAARAAPAEAHGARAVAAALRVPHVLFRDTSTGSSYGQVAIVPAGRLAARRAVVPLACDRIDFRAGRGICLQTHPGVFTKYDALILDDRLRVLHRLSLPGSTSRARISPDGRLAAYTVFVTGDSYAAVTFSTRTGIIDTTTGKQLAQLEHFTVLRDGSRIHAPDFNFWGVTFAADSDHFYATLATRGATYLVGGTISSRTVRVLREGVECPSVSPDGTRLAFKQRVSGAHSRVSWRPAILDLKTLRARVLPETRSVDDQIAWLDRTHVAYGLPVAGTAMSDVWSVAADGSGKPVRILRDAWSPSVVAA